MDNVNELSSSLSFASSSYLSNGSSSNHVSASASSQPVPSIEIYLSLNKLSGSLERLLLEPEYDYTDAEIIVEGNTVGVNRCILAARSQFFQYSFKQGNDDSIKEGKPKYLMSDLVPDGRVGYEAFKVILNYLYTGKLQPSPREMKELVQLVQRRLSNFVEKAFIEDVIPILVVAFHCQLRQLLSHCIQRVAGSDLDSVAIEKELPHEVANDIKSLRLKSQERDESSMMEMEPVEDKRIRRIHKALDSDDVELVELLLKESDITLDDAYALHYAVAYCDPKVVKEVLGLGLAGINLCNARGHTVLHVAARRKNPAVMVPLLNRGASASEITVDGQTAVAICRRLTRPKDFNENTKQGQESNKDRMCIDLLEREMRRNSMSGNSSIISEVMADDLNVRLDYLENRVAFARLLFPAEAKLAMEMAADLTSMHSGLSASRGSSGNLREVDLNETPSGRTKRLQARMQALRKTVEVGRRFFPHCSEVLDKFLDDEMDMADFILEKGTPEEQRKKKTRFLELKDDVQKAFCKDMAENKRSVLSSSSSSSSSPKEGVTHKIRKR
ncbi:BTB/POZ domain and ankyrin repeat-containing protein NPR2 [Prunus yedoensis var. nudiflora]|uniref:BTB/POZ domain and ankyrin repeat-containing protein NPR2 n=1 Tax=Prunus yedoensis var. nudiflora TaxID=2094558 RepID=A0A314YYA7_PRUYE|nr:BTB/POZ domain and ankyrin repeat-containing protein NPR2 [Prunus yedoensis var. nudiflora]